MTKSLGYHWHANAQGPKNLWRGLVRLELHNATENTEKYGKGFSFYFGLLGFGVHLHRDGDYVISGVQTPVFHVGLTRIETC